MRAEYEFYKSAQAEHPDFFDIMPEWHGEIQLANPNRISADMIAALSAQGDLGTDKAAILATIQQQASIATTPEPPKEWAPGQNKKIKAETNLALRNQAFGYKKPNILDAKLGKVLCGDYAPPAKVAKMAKTSERTTHGTHSFRIAGMRVWHGDDETEWDEDGYSVYERDYGEAIGDELELLEGLRRFVFNRTAGVDKELGQAVCEGFVHEIEQIEEVLEQHAVRMFSSSLLFVFEGKGTALRNAIDVNNAWVEECDAELDERNKAAIRTDSGIAMDDDSDSDFEGGVPPVLSVKLIDFAHAEWKDEKEGPDENILNGVRSLKRLFAQLAKSG